MSTNTNNVSTVQAIGKGDRLTEAAVPAIVATLPEGFDPEVRGAVAKAVIAWAVGDGETPAQKTGPAGDQKITDFGRGVDTLTRAVKRELKGESTPDYLALVRQAAKTANGKGEHSVESIMANVAEALAFELASTDTAGGMTFSPAETDAA